MIPINTSVVSGVALSHIGGETKMLLLERANDRFWCHVTGKIEAGETGWQAIVREFFEETKIKVTRLYNAEYCEQFYEAGKNRLMLIPSFVVLCQPNQPVEINNEHTDYRWCLFDEAIALVPYPNQKALYRHVQAYFVLQEPIELMEIKLGE